LTSSTSEKTARMRRAVFYCYYLNVSSSNQDSFLYEQLVDYRFVATHIGFIGGAVWDLRLFADLYSPEKGVWSPIGRFTGSPTGCTDCPSGCEFLHQQSRDISD